MKLFLAGLIAFAAPAAAQTVAIVGGRVATAAGTIDNGTVLVTGGRITSVGAGLAPPPGARVIDARGGWVTAGIFAGFSRLGLIEIDAVDETTDARAGQSPFSAALDIAPGINPRGQNIAINRLEGVTRAVVAPNPGRDIFGGQGAIITTAAGAPPVVRARAFQFVELGERGAELAGGSRPAAFAAFRNGLAEAQRFARAPGGYDEGRSKDSIVTRADAEALVAVVQGRMPVLIRVDRAQDILNVLALRTEFSAMRPVLVGATEGWLVASEIAAARVPVVAQALDDLPERFEQVAATQSNVGRLVAAGVTVALGRVTDEEARQLRNLPQDAGNLVALTRVPGAAGLTHAQALATITRAPATIFGLADHGELAPGRVADVVVWSGDPLELASAPTAVLIDGREQPLVSRQTRLRDRYLGLKPGEKTLHYRR